MTPPIYLKNPNAKQRRDDCHALVDLAHFAIGHKSSSPRAGATRSACMECNTSGEDASCGWMSFSYFDVSVGLRLESEQC